MRRPTTISGQTQAKKQSQEYQPSIGLVALKTCRLQQKKVPDATVAELWMGKRPSTRTGGTSPQRMGLLQGQISFGSCQTHSYSTSVWSVPSLGSPELQIQVPVCKQGWTKASSTYSPDMGAAALKDLLALGEGMWLFHIFCRRTFVRVSPQHTWGGPWPPTEDAHYQHGRRDKDFVAGHLYFHVMASVFLFWPLSVRGGGAGENG